MSYPDLSNQNLFTGRRGFVLRKRKMVFKEKLEYYLYEEYAVINNDAKERRFTLTDSGGYLLPRERAQEIICSMQAFYENTSDQEIIEYNNWLTEYRMTRVETKNREAPKRRVFPGYVYLIKKDGLYKIGASKNPEDRLATFASTPPFEAEIIRTVYSDNMYELETQFHVYFSEKRVKGEWFSLNDEDIGIINIVFTATEDERKRKNEHKSNE